MKDRWKFGAGVYSGESSAWRDSLGSCVEQSGKPLWTSGCGKTRTSIGGAGSGHGRLQGIQVDLVIESMWEVKQRGFRDNSSSEPECGERTAFSLPWSWSPTSGNLDVCEPRGGPTSRKAEMKDAEGEGITEEIQYWKSQHEGIASWVNSWVWKAETHVPLSTEERKVKNGHPRIAGFVYVVLFFFISIRKTDNPLRWSWRKRMLDLSRHTLHMYKKQDCRYGGSKGIGKVVINPIY